jgi:hypothetical protein
MQISVHTDNWLNIRNCDPDKWQTRFLVREGAPHGQDRKFETRRNNMVMSPRRGSTPRHRLSDGHLWCDIDFDLWFWEIRMKRRVFVSINRRAGYSSLKARLSRFNIVSTAECECGGSLWTEEHTFWDCKLYEGQRVTMRDILPENSKKEYRKSVTGLLKVEGKRLVQGVCYFINKITKFV